VSTRLSAAALAGLPTTIRRPSYDRARLKSGIVHLGIGAFHRAHQAVFTEDAIEAGGAEWGIVGASLQRADVPDALGRQDCLYTVERLGEAARYRVIGAMKQALFALRDRAVLLAALGAPTTHVVTLTLSEKGYCLDGAGALDFSHPDIAADRATPDAPRSAIGWLALGLEQRRRDRAGPATIISCDNLQSNGEKLAHAVIAFAEATRPGLAQWIAGHTEFPLTLVDCIVPAATDEHRARVAGALGMTDEASVQREDFAQWVIANKFAGPVPAWGAVGAQIVDDIAAYQRLKLHVLNTAHSALAYLGLPRGHDYVRQAIADPALAGFLNRLMREEIGPALAPLDAAAYWRTVEQRFRNPMIDHRLTQISQDGSLKLAQRLFPMLIDNARLGRPIACMAKIVAAWLDFMRQTPSRDPANAWLAGWVRAGGDRAKALDNPALFPASFRDDMQLRGEVLDG
jgi:fructuronate reductase